MSLCKLYSIIHTGKNVGIGYTFCKGDAVHPDKVNRATTVKLTDLPNIGPSMADSLRLIGIDVPAKLVGRDPVELYEALCEVTHSRQDLCVLDVLMSVTDFMNGGKPKVWWTYTEERKAMLTMNKIHRTH